MWNMKYLRLQKVWEIDLRDIDDLFINYKCK